MREARKQNVRLVYLNIDSELREYFSYFKGEAAYAEHFSDPLQLIDSAQEFALRIAREVT